MVQSSHAERPGRTLYHIVRGPTAVAEDFHSFLGRGNVPKPRYDGTFDAESLRRAAGVSCFALRDQARDQARNRPGIGNFIAELFIPDDGCAIEVLRTGRVAGHHTVWASPAYFLDRVVSVDPV